MEEREPAVLRTWRRDGSTNLMALDVAVENLSRSGNDLAGPEADRRLAVRKALLAGETLATPHATFVIEN